MKTKIIGEILIAIPLVGLALFMIIGMYLSYGIAGGLFAFGIVLFGISVSLGVFLLTNDL